MAVRTQTNTGGSTQKKTYHTSGTSSSSGGRTVPVSHSSGGQTITNTYHPSGFSNSSGGQTYTPPAQTYTPPAETHTYHDSGFSHSSNSQPSPSPAISTSSSNDGVTPYTPPVTPASDYGSRGGGNSYSGGSSSSSVSSAPAVDYAAQEAARKAAEEAAAKKAAEEEAAKKEAERLEALRLALEAQKKARQDAIDAANAALDKLGVNARNQYDTSRGIIGDDYQDLRNQLAVQNFKAKRAQREALADRGAFNSGNGMQENLLLSANYNNNMNRINRDEANAYTTLLNNLNTYLGQIETQKATNQNSTLDNYNNVISNLINAEYSGYTPDAGYLALAQSIAGNTPTIAVSPTTVTQSSAAPASTDLFNTLNTGLARTPVTGLPNGDLYNTLLRYGIKG